jgi:hypothetical protein
MCEVTCYRIAYKAAPDKMDQVTRYPVYHIKNIKYLVEDIQNNLINTIKYVEFYFNVYNSHASITYSVIKTDYSYVFAPCYNYAMTTEIKEKYFDEVLETLETTLISKSPEIKEIFLDRIDPSKEIMHNWD